MFSRIVSIKLFLFIMLITRISVAEKEFDDVLNFFDKVSIGFEQHLTYRYDNNPFYGADVPQTTNSDNSYGEIFSKLRITAEKELSWTTLESQIAPILMATIDHDFFGLEEHSYALNIDQAWLKFKKPFNKYFDITIGMQDLFIEKSFLIGNGRLQQSALWLMLNQSFPFGVHLEGDFGKLKTDLFWAESKDYWQMFSEGIKDDVDVAGFNAHYDINDNMYVYGGFYKKLDNSNLLIEEYSPQGLGLSTNDDTNNYDIGINVDYKNIFFEGEYTYQNGDAGALDDMGLDRDAHGFFANLRYTFPVKFSPFIGSSYFYFSGDEDLNDDEAEGYDPMFLGFADWNRWFLGELVGENQLPNSNKKVFIGEAGFSPASKINLSLKYLKHTLEEKYYLNIPTSSDNWADELNLFTDYYLNDNVHIFWAMGYTIPQKAAKEIFEDDQNAFYSQIWISFSF